MKKLKFAAFLLAASTTMFFTSCDKDDDDAAPTKTDMLASGQWKDADLLIDGTSLIGSGFYTPGETKITFNKNGTYTSVSDTTTSGSWKFIDNESKLVLTENNDPDTVNIAVLTKSNFNITANESGSNVEFRFIH